MEQHKGPNKSQSEESRKSQDLESRDLSARPVCDDLTFLLFPLLGYIEAPKHLGMEGSIQLHSIKPTY